MEMRFTKSFEREFIKLTRGNPVLKKKVYKQLGLVLKNPDHPSLRFHKLEGKEYWSISVDRSIRILVLIKSETIFVYHIGKHEDVY